MKYIAVTYVYCQQCAPTSHCELGRQKERNLYWSGDIERGKKGENNIQRKMKDKAYKCYLGSIIVVEVIEVVVIAAACSSSSIVVLTTAEPTVILVVE